MRVVLMSVLVAVGLIPALVAAQSDPALDAYKRGTEAFRQDRFAEAADAFREAAKIKPSWKIHYNIGQCEAAAKHYDLALGAFEAYLAEGGDEIPPERQKEVLAEVERLRALVGTLEIADGTSGTVVEINGVVRGTLPEASRLKVSIGQVKLRLLRGDLPVLVRALRLSSGDTVTIAASDSTGPEQAAPTSAAAPAPLPAAATPVADQPRSRQRTVGFAFVGFGGAALVTGAAFGIVALGKGKTVKDDCVKDHCPAGLEEDATKVQRYALAADVLISVGAASAVVGALLAAGVFEKKERPVTVGFVPMVGGGAWSLGAAF